MKSCSKCKIFKNFEEFSRSISNKDGFQFQCKSCCKENNRIYYEENKEKIVAAHLIYRSDKEKARAQGRTYRESHKEEILTYRELHKEEDRISKKIHYENNKNEILAKNKKWRQENKDRMLETKRKQRKKQYQTDPVFRTRSLCRSRFYYWFKAAGVTKTGHVADMIGCTYEELCKYLESKFQPGMTWENQGKWHIDHIKPLALFDPLNPEHTKEAWHHSNLQPLWAKDNFSKGIICP